MPRNTLFGPKMWVKMPNCTGNVRKTPKTHMKPYISRLVSIYGIRWNIYHMLLVKIWNSIATKYPFWAQNGGIKMPNCTGNVRKTPKTHMKPYISRPVSIYGIRWNIYHMLLVKIWNSIASKYPFGPKMGVKMPNCTGNVRKTPKTHMKPYISRPVSIYRNTLEYLSHVVSKA